MKRSLEPECPYLDTVNRSMLDFDFEKTCSVTLSNQNVYSCLVCGQFFQGRSSNTPAFSHALEAGHHVFIHLDKKVVYCLPDGYVVHDSSLDDIVYLLDPQFGERDLAELDTASQLSVALDGSTYVPGIVGLNDIKLNDSLNSVLLSLAHVQRLRDYFLLPSNYALCSARLVCAFGEFVRKVWNRRNYKPQVSPHEVLQAISLSSKKRFHIGKQADPALFVGWFLNELHRDLHSAYRKKRTIIHQCFQGRVDVLTERDVRSDADKEAGAPPKLESEKTENPFLYLTLDLPPAPLFRDDSDAGIIPQVPLMLLLNKFDGVSWTEIPAQLSRKQFSLSKLPRYLIVLVHRFQSNRFFVEKNPTIVTFPVRALDLAPYVTNSSGPLLYDLVSSIRHQGPPEGGTYSVVLHSKAQRAWFDIDSLNISETAPERISLSEAYFQIYEQANQN